MSRAATQPTHMLMPERRRHLVAVVRLADVFEAAAYQALPMARRVDLPAPAIRAFMALRLHDILPNGRRFEIVGFFAPADATYRFSLEDPHDDLLRAIVPPLAARPGEPPAPAAAPSTPYALEVITARWRAQAASDAESRAWAEARRRITRDIPYQLTAPARVPLPPPGFPLSPLTRNAFITEIPMAPTAAFTPPRGETGVRISALGPSIAGRRHPLAGHRVAVFPAGPRPANVIEVPTSPDGQCLYRLISAWTTAGVPRPPDGGAVPVGSRAITVELATPGGVPVPLVTTVFVVREGTVSALTVLQA